MNRTGGRIEPARRALFAARAHTGALPAPLKAALAEVLAAAHAGALIRALFAALLLAVLPLLPGCRGGTAIEPPEIAYGRDTCSNCKMIISEDRFACAYVAGDEATGHETLAFDDVGCMIHFEAAAERRPVVARFVQDFDGGGWIDASAAFYVRSGEIRSPMGSGVVAFATAAARESLQARTHGLPMTLEKLQEYEAARGLLTPPDPAPRPGPAGEAPVEG